MNENPNDLEVGLTSNMSRYSNKKMRKRKHLDALLKVRSTKRNSNELIRSSEDELFLPNQTISKTKIRSYSSERCWYYSKQILSFSFICIFIILCISLISVNMKLKSEVEHLSSRINEMENKFSNINFNNISSLIEQFQTRLSFLERWKLFFKNKSSQIQVNEQLATDIQLENLLHEKIKEWDQQLATFRNEVQSFDQNTNIQQFKISLEQLTNLVHNSSDKTSVVFNEIQSNLDQLRIKIDQCKCSKESIHPNSSIDNSNQIQPTNTRQPSMIKHLLTTATIEKLNHETKQDKNPTDIEHIVN